MASQSSRQDRTRQAIVAGAIETWAENRAATLAQIAAAVGMGRSTVHRYFPDRDELLAAVDQECRRRFILATERARPGEGRGLEACHRLCEEYLGLGPVLGLIFADNALVDPDSWSTSHPAADDRPDGAEPGDGDPFVEAVVRGQQDRSVDPRLPAGWAVTVLWMLLGAASLYFTAEHAPRRDVSTLLTRAVAGAVGTPPADG